MKLINGTAMIFATLALAACGTNTADQTDETVQTEETAQPETETVTKTTYKCEDGTVVEASYPDTDTATVVIGDKTVEMTTEVSASGARYVGDSWEWWTKGMTEGMLAPLAEGETTASAKGVNCTAS
ncbi:MliC family protein [Parasphingorhabdus sp. JC815]|uniref:MliC family protein n=1 Tax=Parasphingorhabdus sp. JC815 TaxID=3232140 RepID=UPI003459E1D7